MIRSYTAAAVFVLAGCGLTDPDPIDIASLEGGWTVAFEVQEPDCSWVPITTMNMLLGFLPNGDTVDLLTAWYVDGIRRPMSGKVDDGDGSIELLLYAGGNGAMQVKGKMTETGQFTGNAVDPAPGHIAMWAKTVCHYRVSGTKAFN